MKLSPPNQFTILIFFSTELWTHSNEGSVKCQKNKTKRRKYIEEISLKIFFSRTTGFQPNLVQFIFGWRGFKFVQMKNYSILIGG